MGVKERQERERRAVQQAILSAARELFVSQGYRNVSIRKIAERIEYSPAAIYSYFDSKDAIFFELAEEGFRLLGARVETAVASVDDPLDALRRALWAFYEFSKAHTEYFELMFVDRSVPSLSRDIERFEFFQPTTARGEAAIRACVEQGIFAKTIDPGAGLHLLWAAMLGPATLGFAKRLGPGEDPDALARDILEAVLAGFQAGVTTTFHACACPMSAASHSGTVRPAVAEHHDA